MANAKLLPKMFLLLFCLLTTVFTHQVFAASPYAAQLRPGFMAGSGDAGTDIYLDVLIPLSGDDQSLFFFNPNFRFDDDDGNEQNIGFGYRSLVQGDSLILGGNLYYDTMKSSTGNHYQQWGLGAEVLSHWVDLRANYYNVFGDTKNTLSGSGSGDYFFSGNSLFSTGGLNIEEALDGFDAEVSVLIPGLSDFMETRLAATYFRFDAKHAEDPDGWRGRIDIRPVQAVNISVEYRDDDLRGSDSFVGGYLELPFSLENLFVGKNPFAGAGKYWSFGAGTRALNQRMTDKVVRDRHIVAVRSQTGSGGVEAVVDGDMIFVNQDNEISGDGSYENPYNTLDSVPADERFAPGAWIYVFSTDDTADTFESTNFTLLKDMVLWGQGYEHPVYGLGGGENPILDGGGSGEVVTLADNNEIMGFTIQNGVTGIYGSNVLGTNIHDNMVRWNGGEASGIHIENNFTEGSFNNLELAYRFENNMISENSGDGIYFDHYLYLDAAVDGLSITNIFANNTIQANSGQGIYAENFLGTDVDGGTVSNSAFSSIFTDNVIGGDDGNGNGSHGILAISEIDIDDTNSTISDFTIDHRYEGNQVLGNAGDGIRDETLAVTIYASVSGISDVDVSTYLANNIVLNNAGYGYYNNAIEVRTSHPDAGSVTNTTLTAEFVDNEFSDNGLTGLHSEQHAIRSSNASVSNSGFTDIYTGNTIERNGSNGIYLDSDFTGGADTYMDYSFVGNQINDNGRDGLYLYIDPSNGGQIMKTLLLQENAITNNLRYGVEVYVNGDTIEDFSGDFGGGLLGSTGGNTFSDNVIWDIYHRGDTGMDIWALGNTWTNAGDPESTIYDSEDALSRGDVITALPEGGED